MQTVRKASTHLVTPGEGCFLVLSGGLVGPGGNTYRVIPLPALGPDQASCDCEWGRHMRLQGRPSNCSHVVAVLEWAAKWVGRAS